METKRTIRNYRDGDEEEIYQLYQAVYPSLQHDRDRWMRWWHWLYKENPAGPSQIYIVEEEAKIIAHLAFISVDLKVGNETTKALQAIDFMIHPDSEFTGLWLLEKKLLQEAEEAG